MTITVRPATPADVAAVHQFIVELADYEKHAHEVEATPAQTHEALFGPAPRVFCELALDGGTTVGFALWFYSYSTFQGRLGIYLEDLYVRPAARGRGAGKALLAALARRCRDEKLGRLGWSVLDWNRPSIAFYESLGARLTDEWTGCRLDGEALAALAKTVAEARS
jgi:GNAT superfamily N-acetyltransferase